jgi:hypothetical protein
MDENVADAEEATEELVEQGAVNDGQLSEPE